MRLAELLVAQTCPPTKDGEKYRSSSSFRPFEKGDTIELVLAKRCIIPDRLYDTNLDPLLFGKLFDNVMQAFRSDKVQYRRFKRYKDGDMTYENYLNKDNRVNRSVVVHCADVTPSSESESSFSSSSSPFRCIGALTSNTKLPVSAFPCKTELNSVMYVRQAIIPCCGGRGSVWFESAHPNFMPAAAAATSSSSSFASNGGANENTTTTSSCEHKVYVKFGLDKSNGRSDEMKKTTDVLSSLMRMLLDQMQFISWKGYMDVDVEVEGGNENKNENDHEGRTGIHF